MNNDTMKHWAEDAAHEFKGLHKTADIYHYLCRVSTIAIFLRAVGILAGSPGEMLGRVLGSVGLLLSVVLLVFQKDTEKVRDYRRHADRYKNVYDALEQTHSTEGVSLDEVGESIADLRKLNADFPISKLAHWWTKRVIHKEMNLGWLED